MSKIGRNEPCPCGSNKKYKKCCLLKKPADVSPVPQNSISPWTKDEDYLTGDSNRVVGLIHEGHLDEAEEGAKQLLIDYPELPDGFDRLGLVYEKRGDHAKAIEMYQKALALTLDDDCYDEGFRNYYRERIATLSVL